MNQRIQARHCSLDDLKFDSKLEMDFYKRLRALLGYEIEIIREPKIQIGVKRHWKIDFQIDNTLIELKGCRDDRLDSKLAAFCRWQFQRKRDFILVYANTPYPVPAGILQLNQSAALIEIVRRVAARPENGNI